VKPQPYICLITPGHVASTPRLSKSADALAEAGYRVRVVAGAPFPPADALDSEMLASARWEYSPLASRRGAGVLLRKALRKVARVLVEWPPFATPRVAAMTHLAESTHLARVAAGIPADLYIGHCIGGLYAAAYAGRLNGRPFGFDIEDYHDAETEEALADAPERRARSILQSRLLPACATLTCAAPLIGRKYEETYGVTARTILNVFPLSQAPAAPRPPEPITELRPAIFYWFSQTIGHGRGLEQAIAVVGRMKTPAEIHLRGFSSAEYSAHLQSTAKQAGLKRPIVFLPPGPPGEMSRLAASADMGLSVEIPTPLNHDICLPNKIFVYLLAGIPQLLSNTSAQSRIGLEFGGAGIVCDMARVDESAGALDRFFSEPGRAASARNEAWGLAQRRFCWDIEKEILLDSVRRVLPLSP